MFRRRSLTLLLASAIALAGCTAQPAATPDPVIVGAWPALEPRLLAEAVAALLRAESIPAQVRELGDAQGARQALELGEVDLLPGYTGAAWLEVLGRSDPPADARTSFARVREFDERAGLLWLRPRFEVVGRDQPPADATFAFFAPGPPAVDARLTTLSQLASRLSEDPEARLCMDRDFIARPDGRDAVYRAYGISLERTDVAADPDTAVRAVRAGECLAGLATRTDGAAHGAGLLPLVDDLQVFPAFVVAVVGRQATLAQTGVTTALGPFASQLTSALLAQHNHRVLLDDVSPAAVLAQAQALADVLRARAGLGAPESANPVQ